MCMYSMGLWPSLSLNVGKINDTFHYFSLKMANLLNVTICLNLQLTVSEIRFTKTEKNFETSSLFYSIHPGLVFSRFNQPPKRKTSLKMVLCQSQLSQSQTHSRQKHMVVWSMQVLLSEITQCNSAKAIDNDWPNRSCYF